MLSFCKITKLQIFTELGLAALHSFTDTQQHAAIIMYGQTGSGKTHTMLGTEVNLSFRGINNLSPTICCIVISFASVSPLEVTWLFSLSLWDHNNIKENGSRLEALLQESPGMIPRICEHLLAKHMNETHSFHMR